MKAVSKLPPAIRILRVAARAACAGDSEFTEGKGRWPAPRATDPTAERTTNSLLFMGSPVAERGDRTATSISRCRHRRCPLQVQLGDRHLAHAELLDLSGHGHRERIDEFPVCRNLVARDATLTKSGQRLSGKTGVGARADPRHHLLAISLARYADHLGVDDVSVREEILLDFARVDVLAAADDHVLDAADDVDIALRIHRREIAGVHPARGIDRLCGPLRIAPI